MPKIELTKEQLQSLRSCCYGAQRVPMDIIELIDRALAEPEPVRGPAKWPASPCGGKYMHSADGTYRCNVCNKWPEEHA